MTITMNQKITSKGDICFSMCLGLNARRHTTGKARGRWEEGHDNSSSIRLCAKPFSFSSLWYQNYCYFMLKCGDEQMEMPRISSQDGRQVIRLASALRQHWFFFSQQQLVRFCVFSIITLQKRMISSFAIIMGETILFMTTWWEFFGCVHPMYV